jgi:hypothetical protein
VTNRLLTTAELAKLGKLKAKDEATRSHNDWSRNDNVRLILSKALQEGADEVVLNGQWFTVKYPGNGKAWVQAKTGYVPCGWFDIDEFVKEHGQAT